MAGLPVSAGAEERSDEVPRAETGAAADLEQEWRSRNDAISRAPMRI